MAVAFTVLRESKQARVEPGSDQRNALIGRRTLGNLRGQTTKREP